MSEKMDVAGSPAYWEIYKKGREVGASAGMCKREPESITNYNTGVPIKIKREPADEGYALSHPIKSEVFEDEAKPGTSVGAQFNSMPGTSGVGKSSFTPITIKRELPENIKDGDGWMADSTTTLSDVKVEDDDDDDDDNFPFPPILRVKQNANGKKDELLLYAKPKKIEPIESDDGDKNVACEEMGICKCRKMRGKNYYEYYMDTKDLDVQVVYPKGRCVLPRGTVLHFFGEPAIMMKREDVITALQALGATVEFLEYEIGMNEGYARLSFPYEGKKTLKKMENNKLTIAGVDLEFRLLSGKEEKRYLLKAVEGIFKKQKTSTKCLEKQLKKAGYRYVTNHD